MSTALQGKLTKAQLPASMGDVYPGAVTGQPWWWTNADCLVVDYATPDYAAAALLPSELTLLPSARDGQAVARLCLATYRGGTLGPYNEVVVEIPCLYEGTFALYVPYVYVDTLPPLAAGREVTGFPRQLARIAVESSDAQFQAILEQAGRRLLSARATRGQRLLSLPLPDAKIELPAPFDQTMPLPEPDGPSHGVPIPTITTRYIPGAIEPQHILSDWAWEHGTASAAEASIDYFPTDTEALGKLPILDILGAIVFRGDLTVHGTTILQDMA